MLREYCKNIVWMTHHYFYLFYDDIYDRIGKSFKFKFNSTVSQTQAKFRPQNQIVNQAKNVASLATIYQTQ